MEPLEPSSMDVEKILAELKADREQIEGRLSLEQLAQGRGTTLGRPPGSPDPNPPLPPGTAMPVPRAAADMAWAVSGRKRPAS
jgi:hypothetical protein